MKIKIFPGKLIICSDMASGVDQEIYLYNFSPGFLIRVIGVINLRRVGRSVYWKEKIPLGMIRERPAITQGRSCYGN